MAEISAAAVKALREKTDLPLMRVKAALTEAGGDEAKAMEILKSQVKGLIEKRANNSALEGRIFVAVKPDQTEAAMVEFACESAPVAGAPMFLALGEALVNQLLNGPGAKTGEELLEQTYNGVKLKDQFEELVNKIGEKFVVARVAKFQGPVGYYIHHDGKTACVFQAEGPLKADPILRDVAMHIVGLKPVFATTAELDQKEIEAERARLTEEIKASGKPANIIDKIVAGKLSVFFRDKGVLAEQAFAKDEAKSVQQVLEAAGFKPKAFTMWVLGN
jgi:elongation factor Ts